MKNVISVAIVSLLLVFSPVFLSGQAALPCAAIPMAQITPGYQCSVGGLTLTVAAPPGYIPIGFLQYGENDSGLYPEAAPPNTVMVLPLGNGLRFTNFPLPILPPATTCADPVTGAVQVYGWIYFHISFGTPGLTSLTTTLNDISGPAIPFQGASIGGGWGSFTNFNFGTSAFSFGPTTNTSTSSLPVSDDTIVLTFDVFENVCDPGYSAPVTASSIDYTMKWGCQVTVPNSWSQDDLPWGPNTYDSYNAALCQSSPAAQCTIGNSASCCRMRSLGCTTTALATALNIAGVSELSSAFATQPFQPGTFNTFMTAAGDYTPATHDVQLERATLDININTLSLRGGKFLTFDDTLDYSVNPLDLKNAVCQENHAVIVKVARYQQACVPSNAPPGGHYVLVTAEHDDTIGNPHFDIVDPGCLHGSGSKLPISSLDAYGNNFVIRGFVSDPTSESLLEVDTDDGADLLLTDASGNRTGFDPVAGTVKQQIPQSFYNQDFVTDNDTGAASGITHSVSIFNPSQSTFSITVTGLKLSSYTLTIAPFSTDGTPQPRLFLPGTSGVGSTSSFRVQFSPVSGSAPGVARVATFKTTIADITNNFQLGLIANATVANSLVGKIKAAASAVAEHEYDDAREMLNSFKRQVTTLTGTSITGVAPQVLQEDASSLIAQLPRFGG